MKAMNHSINYCSKLPLVFCLGFAGLVIPVIHGYADNTQAPSGLVQLRDIIESLGKDSDEGYQNTSEDPVERRYLTLATSTDPLVRAHAVEILGKYKSNKARGMLLNAAFDKNGQVRAAALRVVSTWQDFEAAEAIIAFYVSRNLADWGQLDEILPILNETFASHFHKMLVDDEKPLNERVAAAHCLGQTKFHFARADLTNLVFSRRDVLSVESARALVQFQSVDSLPDFTQMLKHELKEVRACGVEGLARLNTPAALRAIETELLNNFQLDRDLRKRATLWLGVLGDDSTVDALIAIMHRDPYLRRTAAEALRRLTKQPFRDSPREWYDWYARYRESRQPISVAAPPPLVPKGVILPQIPPGFVPGSPSNIEEASSDAVR